MVLGLYPGEYVVALYLNPGPMKAGVFLFASMSDQGIIKYLSIAVSISLWSVVAVAQVDSTQTIYYDSFKSALRFDSLLGRQFSVELADAHIYDLTIRTFGYRLNAGNAGTNSPWPLIGQVFETGFRTGMGMQAHLLPAGSGQYLFPLKAYTRVAYANGASAKENVLDIGFAKPLGTLLNFGFNYQRIGSVGMFSRQQGILNSLSVYSFYRSRNRRYSVGLDFVWANDDSQDNGGIGSDSVFEANSATDRKFIPVRLNQASHKIVRFEVLVAQRLSLTKQDTGVKASSGFIRFDPYMGHMIRFADQRFTYKDVPDTSASALYGNVLLDTAATLDSTKWTKVENSITLGFNLKGRWSQQLEVGATHDWNRIRQMGVDEGFHNVGLIGEYSLGIRSHSVRADAGYVLFGSNITDTRVNVSYSWQDDSFVVAGADFRFASRRPDRIFEHYVSNNFIWSNSFSNEQSMLILGKVGVPKWRLRAEAGYLILNNLMFFNDLWMPEQSATVNTAVVATLQEQFNWKWFNIILWGRMNYFLTGYSIRIPPVCARASLFYDGKVFKKKLRIQIGMDAWYNTRYEPYTYIPALMRFATQSDVSIGNYVSFDAFLNLEVKRFRGFFKVEHWNAGLMGNDYYLLAHQPMNDFAIKFGINWTFFD